MNFEYSLFSSCNASSTYVAHKPSKVSSSLLKNKRRQRCTLLYQVLLQYVASWLVFNSLHLCIVRIVALEVYELHKVLVKIICDA